MSSENSTGRVRATAVVVRGGEVLLVRDRGRRRFSLPGGGVRKGEPSISAAARELYEELGMKATSMERLRECDFTGTANKHRVCLITEFEGYPHLKGHELDKFIWWDMKYPLPAFSHVRVILSQLDRLGKLSGLRLRAGDDGT